MMISPFNQYNHASINEMMRLLRYSTRPTPRPINQRKFRKRRRQTGYNKR